MHPLLPGAAVLLFQEVATSGPECEWPILAAFHRKPELTDRAGRKQTLPPMSVPNSGWSHRGESLPTQEPGLPVSLDGDPGRLPEGDPEKASAQHPAIVHQGLPDLDTNPAATWLRLSALLQQLPPQDSDEQYCLALGEEELAELRLFCAQRRREALGQGVAHLVPPKLKKCTCEKCREPLKPGEYGVFAALAGERHCWHRACFACQACGQALINFIYFYHDGHLYCGRHHAELLRPRCPACDQLIFSRRCTEAEGQCWHENHFCCQDCAGPLGGGRYALQGGGPCCPSCFRSRYSDVGSSPAETLEERPSLAAPPIRQPHAPDPSLGARSSHRASLAGALRGPPGPTPRRGTGEAGLDRIEGGDNDPLHFTTISGASLNAVPSSSQETQRGLLGTSPEQECRTGDEAEAPKGGGQGPLETPVDPKEDAPCPTCSSSSDSEPEGFFFGQRLPLPCKTPRSLQAKGSDTSRKHCIIC